MSFARPTISASNPDALLRSFALPPQVLVNHPEQLSLTN